MGVDQQYVLPPDVVARSGHELRQELRDRLGLDPDEQVLMRPHSRDPAAVVDAEAARLVELFRMPQTIAQAVITYSTAHALEPKETLRRVLPTLRELVNGRVLVGVGSVLAEPIEVSYHEGETLAGFEVLLPVHLAADTEVYLARDNRTRFVALKVGRPGHEAVMRQRLSCEALALEVVGGVVAPELLADGTCDETPYVALSWCAGVGAALAAAELRSDGSDAGRRRLVELVGRVLAAFATLHELAVLHGDISARNVLVDAAGAVTLIDFGFARLPGQDAVAARSVRGIDLTTEPEAALARAAGATPELTAAGEQYSLAATLYVLLTGAERQRFVVERDALLRELAAPVVMPFADHGVTGLGAVEPVVRRALSRRPAERFDSIAEFRDAFELAAASDLSGVARRRQPRNGRGAPVRLLDEVLERLASPGYEPEIEDPISSASSGNAGVAYALLRIGMVREDELLLAHADVWARRAVIRVDAVPPSSLHEGAMGVHCVDALVAAARDDETGMRTAIEAFVADIPAAAEIPDVVSGSAGGLLGCSLLLDALPRCGLDDRRSLLRGHGDEQANQVWQQLGANPDASSTRALGAAHGVVGMLFALLRWHESAAWPLPAEIAEWLHWLAAKAIPEGRGSRWPCEGGAPLRDRTLSASWCNGAAGHASLWTLAERLLNERSYGQQALGAAWTAWESPDAGADLCCGLAGRAYAQLSLYRHTGERVWLDRAQQLADRAVQQVRNVLQPRDSLYHGELGLAILVADLGCPDFGGMPFYEAEGWLPSGQTLS